MTVRLEWKPQDLWIGAFWRKEPLYYAKYQVDLWICLIPCLPLHITWERRR